MGQGFDRGRFVFHEDDLPVARPCKPEAKHSFARDSSCHRLFICPDGSSGPGRFTSRRSGVELVHPCTYCGRPLAKHEVRSGDERIMTGSSRGDIDVQA